MFRARTLNRIDNFFILKPHFIHCHVLFQNRRSPSLGHKITEIIVEGKSCRKYFSSNFITFLFQINSIKVINQSEELLYQKKYFSISIRFLFNKFHECYDVIYVDVMSINFKLNFAYRKFTTFYFYHILHFTIFYILQFSSLITSDDLLGKSSKPLGSTELKN